MTAAAVGASLALAGCASGGDPLTGAPAPVAAPQLRELGVKSLVEPTGG